MLAMCCCALCPLLCGNKLLQAHGNTGRFRLGDSRRTPSVTVQGSLNYRPDTRSCSSSSKPTQDLEHLQNMLKLGRGCVLVQEGSFLVSAPEIANDQNGTHFG